MDLFTITRDNGGVIAWTEEQVAYIIDKYINENYSLKQLGKEFGCSYGTIRNLLHNKGYKSRGMKQGYPRNSFYFNQINTPEKAYWLGFIYADGTVASKTYCISISSIDFEHVEKFRIAIEAINHKVAAIEDNRFNKKSIFYNFSIKDKQLHDDLIKWGCIPNKSLLLEKIPNIPKDYVSHFIRGYFDGDGSLHYLKSTNQYRISFTSGSSKFLEDIRHTLYLDQISLGHSKNTSTYQLQISGWRQVNRILNYLYQDSTENTRLNRKYIKYQECLEWVHRH